jgi:hypothetical protein
MLAKLFPQVLIPREVPDEIILEECLRRAGERST